MATRVTVFEVCDMHYFMTLYEGGLVSSFKIEGKMAILKYAVLEIMRYLNRARFTKRGIHSGNLIARLATEITWLLMIDAVESCSVCNFYCIL